MLVDYGLYPKSIGSLLALLQLDTMMARAVLSTQEHYCWNQKLEKTGK